MHSAGYVPDMKPTKIALCFFLAISGILAEETNPNLTNDDSPMAKDYGRFFDEMALKMQAIDAELMQAQTAKAAAIGVVRFTYTMRDMRDRAEVLDKKYPLAKGDMPPKLREKSETFAEAAKHLGQNGMQRVAAKFADTPEMKFAMGLLREFADGEKKVHRK